MKPIKAYFVISHRGYVVDTIYGTVLEASELALLYNDDTGYMHIARKPTSLEMVQWRSKDLVISANQMIHYYRHTRTTFL